MEQKLVKYFYPFDLFYTKYSIQSTIKFATMENSQEFFERFLEWLEDSSEEGSFASWIENIYKYRSSSNIIYHTTFMQNLKIHNIEKITDLFDRIENKQLVRSYTLPVSITADLLICKQMDEPSLKKMEEEFKYNLIFSSSKNGIGYLTEEYHDDIELRNQITIFIHPSPSQNHLTKFRFTGFLKK